MAVETLKWIGGVDGCLKIIDQRRLPDEVVKLRCETIEEVWDAIKTLAVRGAPAIGVTAAYGVVIGLGLLKDGDSAERGVELCNEACEYLATSRPTAVNLFWALERIKQRVEEYVVKNPDCDARKLRWIVLEEAGSICTEDRQMCRKIGENGEKFIADGMGVLTHCNAGALATSGMGTALAVLYEAHKKGRRFKVYADETRPLLQGARLTAWELQRAGIDVTVICDNMAGWLMKQGRIDAVITGADRIAANGDAANKIGTYSLSILAKEHGVPFYVAAPSSTFDLSIASGARIPIEERSADEVRGFGGVVTTPEEVGVYNPGFDVTPAGNITAIITEKGIIEKPLAEKIQDCIQ
ncbi:MAG: S-methyl-5-thioribose-1-phosphate isomerase [Planctomycetota bacterium]|jgi:methylthioribose-1-phosphate isomerase